MDVHYRTIERGIACLEVKRPEVRNALDWHAMEAFAYTVAKAQKENDLLVLIVSGYGRSFIAGGDLKALHTHTSREDGERLSQLMTKALADLESLSCPVIAAVNGPARGGGAEIALACDLRYLAEDADLGFVQSRLGLTPGWGAGQRLLHLVGYSKAFEWLVTGRVLSAQDALRHGLANQLAPAGGAFDLALETAQEIAKQPRETIQAIKALLQNGLRVSKAEAEAFEQKLFPDLWAAPAHLEAASAVLKSKSTPNESKT